MQTILHERLGQEVHRAAHACRHGEPMIVGVDRTWKREQDVEQSTVSAVRTVAWAARLLGMKVPAVYARAEELPSGIALVPAAEPTVALGKSLLSGRSVPELTFRIAWELAYERTTLNALTWRRPDLR